MIYPTHLFSFIPSKITILTKLAPSQITSSSFPTQELAYLVPACNILLPIFNMTGSSLVPAQMSLPHEGSRPLNMSPLCLS